MMINFLIIEWNNRMQLEQLETVKEYYICTNAANDGTHAIY